MYSENKNSFGFELLKGLAFTKPNFLNLDQWFMFDLKMYSALFCWIIEIKEFGYTTLSLLIFTEIFKEKYGVNVSM